MANSRKNLLPSLKQLGLAGTLGTPIRATNLVQSMHANVGQHSVSIGGSRESKSLSGVNREATPISFGKAHLPKASATGGSEWTKLLGQVTSNGFGSLLGGGSLLSFGGIKSLVSGIEGLFGSGKSTPPPLVAFQPPASQNQNLSIGGQNTIGSLQDQSAAVAQAVKTALLHSSSLNDVIAEL